MKCTICGRKDALIRRCEMDIAPITHRAHVDCDGHSEYRHVSDYDIEESKVAHADEWAAAMVPTHPGL